MEILQQLDAARAQRNVLEHPFYVRWSAGELSAAELALYAGEYRHAVVALAEASSLAAEAASPQHASGLQRHAQEEREHVAVWDEFERAACAGAQHAGTPVGAGAERAPEPLAATRACAQAWTAGESLLEHLAVLYAIEAGQPQVSQTKLDGLREHYGYSAEGPATEYFRLHGWLDVEHARSAGELIEELAAGTPAEARERAVQRARDALAGNWELLSGVEAAAA